MDEGDERRMCVGPILNHEAHALACIFPPAQSHVQPRDDQITKHDQEDLYAESFLHFLSSLRFHFASQGTRADTVDGRAPKSLKNCNWERHKLFLVPVEETTSS